MPNIGIIALAALLPVVSFPLLQKFLGPAQPLPRSGGQQALRYVLFYLGSFFLAFSLQYMVIHQAHVMSVLIAEPGFPDDPKAEATMIYEDFMRAYGQLYRSFGHGFLHGGMTAIFFVWPILGMGHSARRAEGEGLKNLFVQVGYWFVVLGLMGGIICQWA